MHRKFRAAVVLAAAFFSLAEARSVAADKAPEKIVGKSLTILRDADTVTVEQGDRILLRYRYAKDAAGPRVTEINSPDGVRVPGDVTFAWTIDGVDFCTVPPAARDAGTQLHEKWLELRIDSRGGKERAVLVEQLVWETPDGDFILEEQRTLTVPAADAGRPQMLLWQSNVTPGEDAVDVLAIGGSKSGGFGVRFGPALKAAPQYFNPSGHAMAVGSRAPWAACTTATDGGKVTVAVFDAPGNPRHPTGWAANGAKLPASLVATSSLQSQPLRLEPGKTLSVRFGVAAIDGAVEPRQVDAAYLDWYRLQTAARSGLVPGLLAQYTSAAASNAPACARIDRSIAFDFSGGMPDDRLPRGPFSVVWTGQVRIDRDGEYRFFGRCDGRMEIRVGDKPADGEVIRLEYGYHPIRVQYAAGGSDASAKLYWESDYFGGEPVNPRYLVHDASAEADLSMDLLHDAGSAVVVRYGCARCHATTGVDAKLRPGRPLAFASQANPDYLDRYLRDPQSIRPGTAMPSPGGKPAQLDADVPALVAYIKSLAPPKQVQRVPQDTIATADADAREVPTPMTWVRMPAQRAGRLMGMGRSRDPLGWPGGPMGWPGSSMGWPGTGFRLPLPPVAPDTSKADAVAAVDTVATGAAHEELVSKGRERFRQLGCAACHAPEAPGRIDTARAPSLADVGAKWPEEYVRRFLLDPVGWHPQGNMPDFKLRPLDATQLAAYLSTFTKYGDRQATKTALLGQPWKSPVGDRWQPVSVESPDARALVARGKTLVKERGCAACHLIDGIESPPAARLGAKSDLTDGCLRSDRSAGVAPQFHIPLADRLAAAEFLARRPQASSPVAVHIRTRRIIEDRYGCYRCHVRDGHGGDEISRAILRHATEDKITDQVSLTPPDISGVGNRLKREWMLKVLAGDAPTARPWLKVRMPRFAMSEQERTRVADLLATADAIPALTAPRPNKLPAAMKAVAGQLLGGSGFSCINCHYVGKTPSSSETSAPDLTMITRRVDRDWFHRWLSNPARIIPTTPMPAFNVPATKIAGEDLLVQKETLWQFLKHTPGSAIKKMMAESTTAVQVAGLRPSVVQGRLEGFVGRARGIAVGFSNGQSMAFDYERVAWRAAWKGGFLDEAGRHGAQHYWQPVGTQTWLSHDNGPPILYREKATGRWIGPALWRNRFGFVDRVTLIGRAVQIDYRLRAPGERTGTHEPQSWVRVTETIEPNPTGTELNGTTRTIHISGVPDGYDVIVQQSTGGIDAEFTVGTTPLDAIPAAEKGLPAAKNPTLTIQEKSGRRWAMRISGDESAHWVAPPESIAYPVEQPFTDELPMDPKNRYEAVVEPGAGRIAVAVSNRGSDKPVELVWQTAEHLPGPPIVAGSPKRWPKPPEAPVLQDPKKPRYVSYPAEVAELGQSFPLSVEPGFKIERLPLEEEFLVCGLNFYKGKLLVGGYDGELRIADDTDGDGLQDSYRYFGGTLQQITNLRVYDDEIYVTAPGALYRVRDLNDDDVADSYQLLSSLWDCSSHQNDWFFGLTRDKEGNLYGGNATPYIYRPGGKPPGYYLRGDVLKITPDGRTIKVGTGLRFQFGWAENRDGRMYFNINQGHYNYTNGIHLVTEGAHYGFLEPDLTKVQWPVVRVPYPWCKSLNGMDFAESPVPFGPFQGHGFSADYNTNQIIRFTDYPIDAGPQKKYLTGRQGTCYPFLKGTDAGPTEIVFGPDGAMYIGFMCDQGWYGGRSRGGIYKVTYTGEPTFAVREARAVKEGFRIELTTAADPATVTPAVCPKVRRWWHENKGAYASPEIAHEDVPVTEITLSPDGKTLLLAIESHVTPRLYRIDLKGLRSTTGRELADGLIYPTVHWVEE